jgi:hypothetical protein
MHQPGVMEGIDGGVGQVPQRPRGADLTHRRPGAFDPWTSSHIFADANASPCGVLLAMGQNHPGQMVPINHEPL